MTVSSVPSFCLRSAFRAFAPMRHNRSHLRRKCALNWTTFPDLTQPTDAMNKSTAFCFRWRVPRLWAALISLAANGVAPAALAQVALTGTVTNIATGQNLEG